MVERYFFNPFFSNFVTAVSSCWPHGSIKSIPYDINQVEAGWPLDLLDDFSTGFHSSLLHPTNTHLS